MEEYRRADRIAIYLSMEHGEIQTGSIVHDALSRGKTVFVPCISRGESHSVMDMLALASVEDHQSLPRDKWGIPSLPPDSLPDRENWLGGKGNLQVSKSEPESGKNAHEWLDLIMIPGMAFDVALNRLGHGKGYYDRFLRQYSGLSQRFRSGEMPPLSEWVCILIQLTHPNN